MFNNFIKMFLVQVNAPIIGAVVGVGVGLLAGSFLGGGGRSPSVPGPDPRVGEASEAQAKALEEQARLQAASLEEQRKMNNLQAARQRREAFREARAAQGSVIQAGAESGTMMSSGLQGGRSTIAAQLGSNISFLDQMQTTASQASIFNIQAARQAGIASRQGALLNQYSMEAQAAAARRQESSARMGSIGSLIGAGIGFAVTGGNPMGAQMGAGLGGTAGGLFG